MAASVRFNEYNGESATETQGISNLNFGSVDAPNLNPADYPIQRGDASYDKWIKLDFYGGVFNRVSDFKFWRSDGNHGDGPDLPAGISVVGEVGTPASGDLTYTTPTQTALDLDPVPNTEATAWSVGPSELVSYGKTYYIHLQLQTTTEAATGDIPPIYWEFKWTEE